MRGREIEKVVVDSEKLIDDTEMAAISETLSRHARAIKVASF